MSTVTLNAYAYPHILDNIIEHSSYDTLLLLRRVSHTTRRKADARLARHVILQMPDFGPPVASGEMYLREFEDGFCRERVRTLTVLSAVDSFAPAPDPSASSPLPPPLDPPSTPETQTPAQLFAARFPRVRLPQSARPLPGTMGWRDACVPSLQHLRAEHGLRAGVVTNMAVLDATRRERKRALERCYAAVRGVEVVDVPAMEGAYLSRGFGYGAEDITAGWSLKAVRFHQPPWGGHASHAIQSAARHILFVPLLRISGQWCLPGMPGNPSTKDIVYHFTGWRDLPEGFIAPLEYLDPVPRNNVVQFTFIFTDLPRPEVEESEEGEGERYGDKWLQAIAPLLYLAPTAQFTLVDAFPALFGVRAMQDMKAALEAEAVRMYKTSAVRPRRAGRGHEQVMELAEDWLETVPSRVSWLPRDEYRARVGDEVYRLDMVGLPREHSPSS